MKLFGYIVIAALVSLPNFAFAQTAPEKDPSTEKTTVVEAEKTETKQEETLPKAPAVDEVKAEPEIKAAAKKVEIKKAKESEPTRMNGVKKQSGVGYLISIDEDEFVIDLGSNDGLKQHDSVEFFEIQEKGFGDEKVTVLEPLTLGLVLEVTKKHARVRIPMNIVVPVGSAVMKTKTNYVDRVSHRERPTGTEFTATVRPFIPLETLGIGAVVDFEAIHRFEDSPLTVALVLSPLAFAVTNKGRPNFMTFYGQVSYDAKYFEIGLGAGGAKTTEFGVSATQFLRLGTHDGLNIKGTTYLIGIDKFEFHGLKLAVQVPTDTIFKNTWIVGRMSFQEENQQGLGYGELGVRTLIKGRGTSGSIFLTPFLGAVSMTETRPGTEAQCDYYGGNCGVKRTFGGPSAGLTVEWRP